MSKTLFFRFSFTSKGPGATRFATAAAARIARQKDGQPEEPTKLRFDDYRAMFRNKTTSELFRALFVLKLSSIGPLVTHSETVLKSMQKFLGKRLFERIMKATMYGHFVAGNEMETIRRSVERLREDGIRPFIMIPIEEDSSEKQGPEERYDRNAERILEGVHLTDALREPGFRPMGHWKLTSILPGVLCEKIGTIYKKPLDVEGLVENMAGAIENKKEGIIPGLTAAEQQSVNKSFIRMRKIIKEVVEKDVVLMVDAEQTYLNPTLNLMTLAMAFIANKSKPLVWFTYQNYEKGMTEKLKLDTEFVRSHNLCFGAKLVRGAYMDQERSLAAKDGCPCPINDTFEDTTRTYYNSVEYILQKAVEDPDHISFIMGSHNEETILWALERLKDAGVPPNCQSVVFGQVQGIGDHISCTLGQAGYTIYKSVPCGSVDETIMYLSRRAKENRSTLLLMKNDANLLRNALLDRLKPKVLKT